jgi:hypothetical protein
MSRQLSIFGVEARPPSPLDLEGLLAGPGQVVRMGGTARVSVVLEEAWRVPVLLAECAVRGVPATCEPATLDGHLAVRTAYSAVLAPLGSAWLRGAVKHPPPGFALDGRRLRFWAIAAGAVDGAAYLLRLSPSDEPAWGAVGRALGAVGLQAVLLGPRAGGPGYRIVGRRRLARLAELVGDPPRGLPPDAWPVG